MEHSTMPQMASHVGSRGCPAASGFAALMATWATRRQAKNMQMNPVPKRVRMAFFLLRAIWRFHVSFIGRAMTVVQRVRLSVKGGLEGGCVLMRFVAVSTEKE